MSKTDKLKYIQQSIDHVPHEMTAQYLTQAQVEDLLCRPLCRPKRKRLSLKPFSYHRYDSNYRIERKYTSSF